MNASRNKNIKKTDNQNIESGIIQKGNKLEWLISSKIYQNKRENKNYQHSKPKGDTTRDFTNNKKDK